MMRITRIEPVTKTKYRVSVDEQFAFGIERPDVLLLEVHPDAVGFQQTYCL